MRNLTFSYNESHIAVMWIEPEMPNGEISYNVSISGMDLATNETVLDGMMGSLTATQVTFMHMVEPYALYTIECVPVTIAGSGRPTTVSFQTPEGGKNSHITQVDCFRCIFYLEILLYML